MKVVTLFFIQNSLLYNLANVALFSSKRVALIFYKEKYFNFASSSIAYYLLAYNTVLKSSGNGFSIFFTC